MPYSSLIGNSATGMPLQALVLEYCTVLCGVCAWRGTQGCYQAMFLFGLLSDAADYGQFPESREVS